jgi:hypothetical protein
MGVDDVHFLIPHQSGQSSRAAPIESGLPVQSMNGKTILPQFFADRADFIQASEYEPKRTAQALCQAGR